MVLFLWSCWMTDISNRWPTSMCSIKEEQVCLVLQHHIQWDSGQCSICETSWCVRKYNRVWVKAVASDPCKKQHQTSSGQSRNEIRGLSCLQQAMRFAQGSVWRPGKEGGEGYGNTVLLISPLLKHHWLCLSLCTEGESSTWWDAKCGGRGMQMERSSRLVRMSRVTGRMQVNGVERGR